MDAAPTLAELRQPTRTERLSPAMRRYLQERVTPIAGPQRSGMPCTMRLYQCLGDPGSARALGEDLRAFASAHEAGDFIAVFECPCGGGAASFAAALQRHLALMREADAAGDIGIPRPDDGDRADFRLRVLGEEFLLIALHADAAQLSRVLPCPALLLQRAAA